MKAPSTTIGTVAASLGLLAVGGGAAATAVGLAVKKDTTDAMSGAILTIEAGVFGVMAAGFGGMILAVASPKWRGVGETAALIGVGAPLVLGTLGLVKATIAQAETPAQIAATPQTYQVDSSNTGQSFQVNIGDTINLVLDSTMPAPTASATGILSAGATSTQTNSTATPGATGETTGSQVTYPYTAVAAGSVTLTSTPTTGTAFTMTVTAS